MLIDFALGILILHTVWAENISIESKNPTLKNKLERLTSNDKKTNMEAINSFLKEQRYYVAEVTKKKYEIKVKNPVLWDTFFSGNETYTSQSLKKMIIESTFTPKIETFPLELRNRLQAYYQEKGFHFVKIKVYELKPSFEHNKKLMIEIQEGHRVKISNYKITGKTAPFTKSQLLQKLKSYASPPISKGYYSANTLRSSILSLQNDLKNLGYFQSKFVVSSVHFNKKKTVAKVTFNLELGSPTLVKSINFIGVTNSDPFILKTLLGLEHGKILNLYSLEKGLNLIEDYYYSRGFLDIFISQENIVTYSNNLETATLNIEILERHQTLVHDIQIVGLKKTKAYVVYNELEFQPGQVLTLDKIRDSSKNLQNLGIFSNVSIKPAAKKMDSNYQTIIVSLKERKPGSFAIGLGLNTELGFTFKTFLQVDYANLWGTARSLSTQFEISRNLREVDYLENKLSLSYTEPYLIGKHVDGRVNFSRVDEIWNFNNQGPQTLVTIIKSNRLDLVLDNQFNKNTRLTFYALSLDLRSETELRNRFDPINERIISLGPKIEFDYRDKPYTTSKGTLTEIQVEYATPLLGSQTESKSKKFDLEYFQIQSSFSFYKSLGNSLILAQAFRGGYLHNFSQSTDSNFFPFPKSRAFFLGGATTIRGFDPSRGNERIPNDQVLEEGGLTVDGQTLGGGLLSIPSSSHYYLSKTEFRFPLAKNSNFWGNLFYDGGSVQIQSKANLDPWRHSIGLGFRYVTPLGPLFNIEIAYKLDRKSEFDESATQIHLSVASF